MSQESNLQWWEVMGAIALKEEHNSKVFPDSVKHLLLSGGSSANCHLTKDSRLSISVRVSRFLSVLSVIPG